MPTLMIDNQCVTVPEGATILQAAHTVGIEIPTLCYAKDYTAETSCLVCLVRVDGKERLVPSCATVARDGMIVESETPDVHAARRGALELLLAEHLGDCLAPCQIACPAHIDVPHLLRDIAAGQKAQAAQLLLQSLALPRVLSRLCPANSEKACRRAQLDEAVAICRLHRFVADNALGTVQLASLAESGKSIAIVGASAAGLSAAYFCRLQGHDCHVYHRHAHAGGKLLGDEAMALLLKSDLERIKLMGVIFHPGNNIDEEQLDALLASHDAVVLACGEGSAAVFPQLHKDIPTLRASREHASAVAGLFLCGAMIAPMPPMRAAVDGRNAAMAINHYLDASVEIPSRFSVHIGRMSTEDLQLFARGASGERRLTPDSDEDDYHADEAIREALRCLHCDCRALQSCALRSAAIRCHANPLHYRGGRRPFTQDITHPRVIFEAGKCISCGLCIQAASRYGETMGLTFLGRGFTMRTGVPFEETLASGLQLAADEVVRLCPTGALAWKNEERHG